MKNDDKQVRRVHSEEDDITPASIGFFVHRNTQSYQPATVDDLHSGEYELES